MLTLIGNNGFKRFNLAAILGAGFNYYDFGDNDPKYTRVNTISGNFSIQASYNVNRKFSVFIEPVHPFAEQSSGFARLLFSGVPLIPASFALPLHRASLLIEKYHISPERISESTPEAMGYENKTGCNAMIVYITVHKISLCRS